MARIRNVELPKEKRTVIQTFRIVASYENEVET